MADNKPQHDISKVLSTLEQVNAGLEQMKKSAPTQQAIKIANKEISQKLEALSSEISEPVSLKITQSLGEIISDQESKSLKELKQDRKKLDHLLSLINEKMISSEEERTKLEDIIKRAQSNIESQTTGAKGTANLLKDTIKSHIDFTSILTGIIAKSPVAALASKIGLDYFKRRREEKAKQIQEDADLLLLRKKHLEALASIEEQTPKAPEEEPTKNEEAIKPAPPQSIPVPPKEPKEPLKVEIVSKEEPRKEEAPGVEETIETEHLGPEARPLTETIPVELVPPQEGSSEPIPVFVTNQILPQDISSICTSIPKIEKYTKDTLTTLKSIHKIISKQETKISRVIPGRITPNLVEKKTEQIIPGTKSINSRLKSPTEFLGKINVSNILKGAAALTLIAGSIFITAKALQTFATVPWSAVAKGFLTLGGLSAFAAILGAAAPIITAGIPILYGLAGAITALGIASLAAGFGLKIGSKGLSEIFTTLENIKWSTIFKAISAITALGIVFGILGPLAPLIALTAIAIVPLGFGLHILSGGLKDIAQIRWASILKGALVLGVLGTILGALGILAPLMILTSVAFTTFGIALIPLSSGLEAFSKLEWKSILKGITILGLLGGLLGILGLISPLMLATSIALGIFSASLITLSTGLSMLSTIKWNTLKGATKVLSELAKSLALFGIIAPLLLLASSAFLVLGIGMISLSAGLKMLENLKWRTLAAGIGTLTTLAISLSLLAPFAPLLAIIGIGFTSLGVGLISLGLGLKALPKTKLEGIIKPLLKFATGISLIGALSPLIIMAAAALGTFGLATITLSIGLALLAKPFQKITNTLKDFTEIINKFNFKKLMLFGVGMAALAAAFVPFTPLILPLSVLALILPPIVKSLGELQKIQGRNLKDLASGLLALATAMPLFFSASIVSGILNFGNAIISFFTGDPIKKFQKFAEIGPPLKIAAEAIQKLSIGFQNLQNVDIKKVGKSLKEFFKIVNKPLEEFTQRIKALKDSGGEIIIPALVKLTTLGAGPIGVPAGTPSLAPIGGGAGLQVLPNFNPETNLSPQAVVTEAMARENIHILNSGALGVTSKPEPTQISTASQTNIIHRRDENFLISTNPRNLEPSILRIQDIDNQPI